MLPSDHTLLIMTKFIIYRKHKVIATKVFGDCISTLVSNINLLELTLEKSAELYNKILTDSLDVVAR